MATDALACGNVPACNGGVGRGGEDDARIARPGEVDNGAFVARKDAVVGTGVCGVPEHYGRN